MSWIDGFIYDAQVSDLTRAANDSVAEYRRQLNVMNEANAVNLTLRYALARQLEKVDPQNPLIKDQALVERLKKAGRTAFALSPDTFDGAREVGRTFKIPGRD